MAVKKKTDAEVKTTAVQLPIKSQKMYAWASKDRSGYPTFFIANRPPTADAGGKQIPYPAGDDRGRLKPGFPYSVQRVCEELACLLGIPVTEFQEGHVYEYDMKLNGKFAYNHVVKTTRTAVK